MNWIRRFRRRRASWAFAVRDFLAATKQFFLFVGCIFRGGCEPDEQKAEPPIYMPQVGGRTLWMGVSRCKRCDRRLIDDMVRG